VAITRKQHDGSVLLHASILNHGANESWPQVDTTVVDQLLLDLVGWTNVVFLEVNARTLDNRPDIPRRNFA
jgi:hypothetical protein